MRLQICRTRDASVACTLPPRVRLLARVEQEELEPVAQPLAQAGDDAGVEEEPRGERIREDEPDRRHGAVRVRSARAMRSASDAPSRPWKRSASIGVPHAGQPSTPKTVTGRPSSSRRSESPSAPTGAWSSTTKSSLERLDKVGEPLAIDAVEPGHIHDLNVVTERLGGIERLVEHYRPVGEEQRVGALAHTVPRPGVSATSGSSMCAAKARSRA